MILTPKQQRERERAQRAKAQQAERAQSINASTTTPDDDAMDGALDHVKAMQRAQAKPQSQPKQTIKGSSL